MRDESPFYSMRVNPATSPDYGVFTTAEREWQVPGPSPRTSDLMLCTCRRRQDAARIMMALTKSEKRSE